MAPSNLQGLNIVHNSPPQNPYLSDQDLLSVPPFPDLAAQLDLWTNLNFQSDEPLVSRKDDASEKRRGSLISVEDDGDRYNLADEGLQNTGKVAESHSHENVVTGTVVPPAPVMNVSAGAPIPQIPGFDIGSILAGFGIDPFQVPPVPQVGAPSAAPSLAQLLSFHTAATLRSMSTPTVQSQPVPAQTSSEPTTAATNYPASKRARTTPRSSTVEAQSPSEPASPVSPEADDKTGSTPPTASEDKRRRNTAASARFRLKKKEREAALEKKAKELETRVSELEKECEALRRENGWLKGLVVGVTGAGAVQQQQQVTTGGKRTRDEADTSVVQ